MVYYFQSNIVQPPVTLFMGIDKHESECCTILLIIPLFNYIIALLDEDLIKWGWPEDVWFHVDKVSSAHVYLRLRKVSTSPCYEKILTYLHQNLY